jgi:hypothetical protein
MREGRVRGEEGGWAGGEEGGGYGKELNRWMGGGLEGLQR